MSSSGASSGLFNRPKWAASAAVKTVPANKNAAGGKTDDFFSRRDPTFDLVAAREEGKQAKDRKKTPNPQSTSTSNLRHSSSRNSSSPSSPIPGTSSLTEDDLHSPKRRRLHHAMDKFSGSDRDRNRSSDEDDDFDEDAGLRKSKSAATEAPAFLPRGHDQQPVHTSQSQVSVDPVRSSASPSRQLLASLQGSSSITEKHLASSVRNESSGTEIIAIDSDDDVKPDETPNNSSIAVPDEGESAEFADDSEEDEELAEHIRRARQELRGRTGDLGASVSASTSDVLSPQQLNAGTTPSHSFGPGSQVRGDDEKPIITFMITSIIPNTSQMAFKRRSNQRLKEVRQYWCKQNDYSDENTTNRVILTWNGQRWYDAMSAEDFGIGAGDDGNGLKSSTGRYQHENVYDDKIHLVAVLESQYEAEQIKRFRPDKSQDQKNAESDGASGGAALPESEPAASDQTAAAPSRYRITLRAKGFDEQKLSVPPDTTMSRITGAFAKLSKVPGTKEIVLMFDGEILALDARIGDTDVEDDSVIDVHVR